MAESDDLARMRAMWGLLSNEDRKRVLEIAYGFRFEQIAAEEKPSLPPLVGFVLDRLAEDPDGARIWDAALSTAQALSVNDPFGSALRIAAARYEAHEDFREEWRL